MTDTPIVLNANTAPQSATMVANSSISKDYTRLSIAGIKPPPVYPYLLEEARRALQNTLVKQNLVLEQYPQLSTALSFQIVDDPVGIYEKLFRAAPDATQVQMEELRNNLAEEAERIYAQKYTPENPAPAPTQQPEISTPLASAQPAIDVERMQQDYINDAFASVQTPVAPAPSMQPQQAVRTDFEKRMRLLLTQPALSSEATLPRFASIAKELADAKAATNPLAGASDAAAVVVVEAAPAPDALATKIAGLEGLIARLDEKNRTYRKEIEALKTALAATAQPQTAAAAQAPTDAPQAVTAAPAALPIATAPIAPEAIAESLKHQQSVAALFDALCQLNDGKNSNDADAMKQIQATAKTLGITDHAFLSKKVIAGRFATTETAQKAIKNAMSSLSAIDTDANGLLSAQETLALTSQILDDVSCVEMVKKGDKGRTDKTLKQAAADAGLQFKNIRFDGESAGVAQTPITPANQNTVLHVAG